MKSKSETQVLIKNAVEVGSVLGIESMVVDKTSLRGENQELGVLIIMPASKYDLEVDAIGITNVPTLKSRLNMLPDCQISYSFMDKYSEEKIVGQMKLSHGRTSVSYKCGDPKMIRAAKVVNDPTHYKLQLKEEDLQTVTRGIGTMGSEYITINTDDTSAFFKISDAQGDVMSHELDGTVEYVQDDGVELTKTYKAKTLRTIFTNYIRKDSGTIMPVEITRRGVMKLLVLGMTIYVFPER